MDFCVFCGIPCYPMDRLVDHGIFIAVVINLGFLVVAKGIARLLEKQAEHYKYLPLNTSVAAPVI